MSLSQLILTLRENEVAQATFGGESWYVKKSVGTIRYCSDETGLEVGELVPLTKSNLEAEYEIVIKK
jgi:hypothetical protein